MKLAVIVPILNEERSIAATLEAVRLGAPGARIVVVDGGSTDRGPEIARSLSDLLVRAPRGRARQMNAGAALAENPDAVSFVHADTIVPPEFGTVIQDALADPHVVGGRFDLELDCGAWHYRMLAMMINLRSRLMRSGTGDQAIFVRREVFSRLGGFPEIDLCEDVEFMRRLRQQGTILCLHAKVLTSARRWQRHGFLRTIVRMWTIKSLFLLGLSPAWLKRHYADAR